MLGLPCCAWAFSNFTEWGPLSNSLQASHCRCSLRSIESMQAPVAAARAQWLWLAALRHVGSSQTRGWTCAPCIGRQILNLWTAREVLIFLFLNKVCWGTCVAHGVHAVGCTVWRLGYCPCVSGFAQPVTCTECLPDFRLGILRRFIQTELYI